MSWTTANFLDVVKDVSGGNVKTPQSEFIKTGKIPVIDQGKDFIAGFTNNQDAQFKSSDLPVVIFGDHTKSIKYVDFPFAMGADGVKVLSVKDGLDSKFFYHYLLQVKIPDAGYSRHYKFLKELKIPLPPLEEQRRIAAILDKAEALRAKRREAIAKLDQLLQSVFLEMFGDITSNPKKWKKEKLINLVEIDAPLVDPLLKDFSDLLHYGPDRIEKETGKLLPAKTAKEDLIISKKFLCNEKHILYSKIRPNLNKVALCNAKCLCSADVYPIEVKNQLNRVFLWVVLRSKDFLRYAEGFSNRANIPKINRDQLLGYECIIPPLNIQDKFSEKVFQIMEIEMKLTQSDELIQKNISALQQKFFNS